MWRSNSKKDIYIRCKATQQSQHTMAKNDTHHSGAQSEGLQTGRHRPEKSRAGRPRLGGLQGGVRRPARRPRGRDSRILSPESCLKVGGSGIPSKPVPLKDAIRETIKELKSEHTRSYRILQERLERALDLAKEQKQRYMDPASSVSNDMRDMCERRDSKDPRFTRPVNHMGKEHNPKSKNKQENRPKSKKKPNEPETTDGNLEPLENSVMCEIHPDDETMTGQE